MASLRLSPDLPRLLLHPPGRYRAPALAWIWGQDPQTSVASFLTLTELLLGVPGPAGSSHPSPSAFCCYLRPTITSKFSTSSPPGPPTLLQKPFLFIPPALCLVLPLPWACVTGAQGSCGRGLREPFLSVNPRLS